MWVLSLLISRFLRQILWTEIFCTFFKKKVNLMPKLKGTNIFPNFRDFQDVKENITKPNIANARRLGNVCSHIMFRPRSSAFLIYGSTKPFILRDIKSRSQHYKKQWKRPEFTTEESNLWDHIIEAIKAMRH